MKHGVRCVAALIIASMLAACSGSDGGGSVTVPSSASSKAAATVATEPSAASKWAEDLDALDQQIRERHPAPFAKTPESEWARRIQELKRTLPAMSEEDAKVALTELVALLDTHSGVSPEELGFHFYGVALYEFSDGVVVLNATDPSLVGAKLVQISQTPIKGVLDAIVPLVNADNESALHDLRPFLTVVVEFLHSKGIVSDVSHSGFVFQKVDGTKVVVDLPVMSPADLINKVYVGAVPLFSVGTPVEAPPAVRRRGEEIYWSIDKRHKAFVLSYNRTGADASDAIKAMSAALDRGAVTRVVLDMRYARGDSYDPSSYLRAALQNDTRINTPGGLVVVIGREDVSASTAFVATLEETTKAIFVGEPTPARPATPGNEQTFVLPNSAIPVHFPTSMIAGDADTRNAISPDIAATTSSADFFAGADPVLVAALNAKAP